uniref:Translation initiation factor IF-3, mitochondrial n=1 Tax=Callorhinchus milii TaxID=7868 RepID=V9L496_CALMI
MAAHWLRNIAFQALRNEAGSTGWYLCTAAARRFSTLSVQAMLKITIPQSRCNVPCWKAAPWVMPQKTFGTAGGTETEAPKEKKNPRARKTIGNIGRKIHHRIIQVIDETGINLGNLHRADAIRLLDERGVRIVTINENADPPLYKLMTGKQIHEAQMKLREKQKENPKSTATQMKEQTFSADIAKHDLQTKVKQIQQWIEKKHHVRITVKKGNALHTIEKMEELLDYIIKSMPDKATYVSRPKAVREGKAVMSVLRHLSEKELNEYKQQQKAHNEAEKLPKGASPETVTEEPQTVVVK